MNNYFPFMHEKKNDKEPELIPLQIQIDEPPPIPKEKQKDEEERGVIIIELI